MTLLLDAFGFLSVVLRGFEVIAQSLTLGGIAFLLLLARPLAGGLTAGADIKDATLRLMGWSALALAFVTALSIGLEGAILASTVGLSLGETLGADFVLAGIAITLAALAIAALCTAKMGRPSGAALVALAAAILLAQTLTSHAAARLDDRVFLGGAELLHQAAAAVWLGGIPYLVLALAKCRDGASWRRVGKRFSQMAMASVAVLVAAGLTMGIAYTGSWAAAYGTSYGIMLGGKIALLGFLLALGGMNFLLIDRLRGDPARPMLRVRRFAEAEIGIAVAVLFAAASLTSLPPAGDLAPSDRASAHEIVERLIPHWPRLTSPDHADLAISQLQARLDAEAAASAQKPQAFIPGAGELPPRNAEDIAWSEYNHHWAGLLVLAIGILALAERSGHARWARNWPLLFLVLAGFLFLRSDPETWPLGDIGFFESLRDPEVLQHRIFVLLIAGFAVFEWRVRTGRDPSPAAALVFPLITAAGGVLLLAHSHALSNVKDQMLIEMTHLPLALLGVAAGWSRWLELRLDPPAARVAAWVWPVAFVLVGFLLLGYREA
ncbi:MAG TPA: CopD family protein [Stellaceae bacterium]|nr:CopD family protein [Stellaceae bacterium]